jgi:hypothetical protein
LLYGRHSLLQRTFSSKATLSAIRATQPHAWTSERQKQWVLKWQLWSAATCRVPARISSAATVSPNSLSFNFLLELEILGTVCSSKLLLSGGGGGSATVPFTKMSIKPSACVDLWGRLTFGTKVFFIWNTLLDFHELHTF